MILIACVDDNLGMIFNSRRQSRDRILRERILKITAGSVLWMSPYTAELFEKSGVGTKIQVDAQYLKKAGSGDYCLAEKDSVRPYEGKCEKILLFHWNRRYPADLYFDIPLKEHGWKVVKTEEFPGSSHDKITEEDYEK